MTSRLPAPYTNIWLRLAVALLLFLLLSSTLPRWWCGLDGHRWYDGDPDLVRAHAREVVAIVERGVAPGDFTAQGELFKHEWQFGTYQMSAIALLQLCLEHPDWREEFLPPAERAIDELLSERIRAFDTAKWGEDALATLETSDRGHAAYLGYLNVVLSLHRRVAPASRHAELNDRISAALVRRLRASRHGILETYPNEAYPVDNAAVLGSLLLRDRAAGAPPSDAAASLQARFRLAWRDPANGLLYQAINPRDGTPADAARASGTAFAAMLVSYGDRDLARELHRTARERCANDLLGFGYLEEYHIGAIRRGGGDIDSGPLVFGVSPSATGFALAGARMFGERQQFVALYRTAHLMGVPTSRGDRRLFITGGPLGNALLLAMLTARPEAP